MDISQGPLFRPQQAGHLTLEPWFHQSKGEQMPIPQTFVWVKLNGALECP